MTIDCISKNEGILTLSLTGRLDTMTAPELETYLSQEIQDCDKLVLDFSALEYISSAGLRVLLGAQQMLDAEDAVTIRHANEYIMETFEMTGFLDFLNVE